MLQRRMHHFMNRLIRYIFLALIPVQPYLQKRAVTAREAIARMSCVDRHTVTVTVTVKKKMPPSRKCEIFVHYVFVQLGGKDRSSRVRYYHHHAWNARIAYGEKGKL